MKNELIEKIKALPDGYSVMVYDQVAGTNACGFKTDEIKALAADHGAIRTAADALVKRLDMLFHDADDPDVFYSDKDVTTELSALRAALDGETK